MVEHRWFSSLSMANVCLWPIPCSRPGMINSTRVSKPRAPIWWRSTAIAWMEGWNSIKASTSPSKTNRLDRHVPMKCAIQAVMSLRTFGTDQLRKEPCCIFLGITLCHSIWINLIGAPSIKTIGQNDWRRNYPLSKGEQRWRSVLFYHLPLQLVRLCIGYDWCTD